MTHKHHIIPKHMGGSDSPDNLIELTVEEHAEAHKVLYEQYGRKEDELAWKGLAGMISKQDIIQELAKTRMLGNKLCVGRYHSEYTIEKMKKNRLGKGTQPKSNETKIKMGDTRFNYWVNKRLKDNSLYKVMTPDNKILTMNKNELFFFCKDKSLRFERLLNGKTKKYTCELLNGD